MVQFTDRLTIDRAHRTKDGYLRVVAKAARSGIQQYLGREVDPEGKHFAADQVVNVYRPPEEVFAADSVASFIGKPVTDDHPSVPVTAANWRDHSRGVIGGAVRDGEWLRFDLALMDAGTIEKVDAGKRELSNGYACDVSIESGITPAGEAYDAVQRKIRGNHVAVVDRARAGSEARISDGGNDLFQTCDAATVILNPIDALEEKPVPKMIILDGLKVDLSDEAAVEAAITKLQGQVTAANDAKAKAETDLADATTKLAAAEVKVTSLEQAVADAKVTPAQLREAGKAYDKLVADAKRLAPALAITDAMDEDAIRKAVVDAKLGDKAKDYDAGKVAIAFDTLSAALADVDTKHEPIGTPLVAADAEKLFADAQQKARAERANAWKTPATGAAA